MKRRLRLGPIENEISFSELQQRYDYLVNKGRLQAIYRHTRPPPKLQKQRKVRHIDTQPPIREVLNNGDAGSHANILVHPNRNISDPVKVDDEIPKYIYTTRLRKPKGHKTVSTILDNVNPRRTFAMKEYEQKETERKLVDTLVADYLCNNNFGHVIPVYEGTGLKTCACCTNRNRENVRNVLGLPTDPGNTAGVNENPYWNLTQAEKGHNIRFNVYPVGKLRREQQGMKMDPSFRLSDETARSNWATSATFELPEFYKDAIVHKTFPNLNNNQEWYEAFPKYRTAHSDISPNYVNNTKHSPRNTLESRSVEESLREADEDDLVMNKRINSADKKYQLAMNNLRRFKAR